MMRRIWIILFLFFVQGLVQLLVGSPVHQCGTDFPVFINPAPNVLEFGFIFQALFVRGPDSQSPRHQHGEADDSKAQGKESCPSACFQSTHLSLLFYRPADFVRCFLSESHGATLYFIIDYYSRFSSENVKNLCTAFFTLKKALLHGLSTLDK